MEYVDQRKCIGFVRTSPKQQQIIYIIDQNTHKSCLSITQSIFCHNVSHRNALESLGIPCFLGGMSRGMLGKNSPLHIRQNRRDALKDADLVLLAGGKQRQLLYSWNMCRICAVFISLHVFGKSGNIYSEI